MNVEELPHYALSAETLAEWVESQPDAWWSADGDSRLDTVLDFPCPSDEMAPAIRKVGANLLVRSKEPASGARGEAIGRDRLDELCEFGLRDRRKILPLVWADLGYDWLLLEDEPLGGD